ncbi:hypothetical protein GC197_17255 [bacterium]|nr:hypothetical protein [bacterium]
MSQPLVSPFRYLIASAMLAALLISPALVHADDQTAYEKSVEKGVSFLANQGQADDGTFSSNAGIGVTAICTTAMLEHGRTHLDPSVKKALAAMEKHVKPDGGIYVEGTRHRNYETCLCLLAFTAANKEGQYDKLITNAQNFLKKLQWDEEEGKSEDDPYYGGAGYGGHSRPDMSNTTFLMEALRTSGVGEDDPAIQKALIFINRCQNLESTYNQTEFPRLNPDGGFYYTPAAGGNSQAGETANGGLRSYGSMTYAGLKSMIYAGVDKDDQRVKAAVSWLGKHYSTKENPGMGATGLYYYYQTVAKALDAYGEDTFVAEGGAKHNWRDEFTKELVGRQQENGSWVNTEATRWMEGDPNLVTGYSLLALSFINKDKK